MIKNKESQTPLVNWELTASIARTCTLKSISSLEMNASTFNDSNNYSGTSSSNSSIVIVDCVINVPLLLAAIFGNSLVLTVIVTSPSLRSQPPMILLSGLAVSDLTVGLIIQPIYIARQLSTNDFILNLSRMMATALCSVSLSTMALISVDRVLALQFHLSYKTVVTSTRVMRTISLNCLLHFLLSSVLFFDKKLSSFVSCALIGMYSVVTTVCYIHIYRIVRRHQLQIRKGRQAVNMETNTHNIVSAKRAALNTFIFYICTCLCYLPWFVCRLYSEGNLPASYSLCILTTTLIFANSALNPLLYCWRLHKLRAEVKKLIKILIKKITC